MNEDDTFLIQLQTKKKTKYQSGDLLKIIPKSDAVPRYYSMGSEAQNILLSVKKHDFGICSNYLSQLGQNDTLVASIEQHKNFHFPKRKKEVIFVANGTGIAPFLGMLNENKKQYKTHLFWGGRNSKSFEIYKNLIEKNLTKNQLSSLHIAYSREKEKQYVQHLIEKNSNLVSRVLSDGGIIMICGSLAMESGVKEALKFMIRNDLKSEFKKFSNQIKTDCY